MTAAVEDNRDTDISTHPIINNKEGMKQRALLVALGLVYYMRLNSEFRENFTNKLKNFHFQVDFLTAFTQEVMVDIQ